MEAQKTPSGERKDTVDPDFDSQYSIIKRIDQNTYETGNTIQCMERTTGDLYSAVHFEVSL